ncbi:MAG TPA: M56 family metallopeptidase [Thermoanaerobaculia bacterium]|nr:M56 family metallopeptidase [Thermoanaerobaculia bacterium]
MTAAVASWLFAATWKGTLLVAFALVVHRVARNRIPSRWLCALLLLAVLRLLAPVTPASAFSVFNLVSATAPAPAAEVMVGESLPRVARTPMRVRVDTPPPAPRPWLPVLLSVWAFGAVVVIGRAVVQTLRFRRRLRDARRVELGDLLEECHADLRRASARLLGGLKPAPHLTVVVTSAVAAPSLHGWVRPRLLLPEGFVETFTRDQLRHALLHELAHLRRSDVLVNWIATAAAALHWFNPLVHLALARLAEERELACDALALTALRAEERQAYGGTVLEIVDRLRSTQLVPALVGMTATPQQLKRRIVMIASFKQPRYSVLFAAMVIAVGLVTLTDAQAHEPKVMRLHKTLSADTPGVKELERPISIDLRSASVADALRAIANAAGVQATLAEGAADPNQRLNVKGANIPAHIVLIETMAAAGLAVKFSETGIEVIKAEAEEPFVRAGGGERVMVRRRTPDSEHQLPVSELRTRTAGDGETGERRQFRIEASIDATSAKRTITVSDADGQNSGTLEVEVVK